MANKNGLYHRDVKVPDGWKDNIRYDLNLKWSNHAQSEARNERVNLINSVSFAGSWVFEWAVQNNNVIKIGVRICLGNGRDLILILANNGRNNATVITCWTNDSRDNHCTLDRRKYIQ